MRWLVLLAVIGATSALAEDGGVEIIVDGPPLPAVKPLTAHELKAGHVGFGFLGASQVLTAQPVNSVVPLEIENQRTTVPLLGVRWWLGAKSRVGFELGAGVMTTGGEVSTGVPRSASLELLGHVGMPIALLSAENVIVFVEPEGRVGFSYYAPNNQGQGVVTATTLELNARGGVEIFFGFIGLENLALEVSARVGVNHAFRSFFQTFNGSLAVATFTRFSTSLSGSPFDVISSSLALRYYF